jgi:DNA repair exonuclease SbcCD nuclease subunit
LTKVAIIADTHWGVRGDSVPFMDMAQKFMADVFFPTLKSRSIHDVVHLGDLVDRRKHISYLTANRLRADFLDKLQFGKYNTHIIAGNHDCYYKNTNRVNALTELVDGNYPNINCYIDPEEVNLCGYNTLFLPWICDENREKSMKLLKESKANVCMGHLEISGFEMYRGSISSHGENRDLFDKFYTTLSGHFHHRSSDGSITYVGSHGEFTWSDYDDPRGFHILDLKTQELEFIPNPYTMFKKVWYDDKSKELDQVLQLDEASVHGKYVKLIVQNKTNPYWFDMFCDRLDKSGPLGMQIVEDHLNLNLEDDETMAIEAESTLDVFRKHIGLVQVPTQIKGKLELLITDLYNQAITVET